MRMGRWREMRGIGISWVPRGRRHVRVVTWIKVGVSWHHARWHHTWLVLSRGHSRWFIERSIWLCFFLFVPVFGGSLGGRSVRDRVRVGSGGGVFSHISIFLFLRIFRRFIVCRLWCFRRRSCWSPSSLGWISWISWRWGASLVAPVSVVLRSFNKALSFATPHKVKHVDPPSWNFLPY